MDSGIDLFDLSDNRSLHSKLVLSKCHLQLGFFVRPWSHEIYQLMTRWHPFSYLKSKEASEDVRDIEQKEPHLAGTANEEQEKDTEKAEFTHADVVQNCVELVQKHLKFYCGVELFERLLDLIAVWEQNFCHLNCFF